MKRGGREKDRAQRLLDRLDERFGRGAVPPNNAYAIDLEIFVRNEVKQELDSQPHLAPTEARGARSMWASGPAWLPTVVKSGSKR